MSLFKTNTTKNYSKPTCANNVNGVQKKQSEKKIIKAIMDRIIRDAMNLFEQKDEDY